MATLAINGHSTRGSEVIEILEMLGGINSHNLYGDENCAYYTIDNNKEIKGGIYVFSSEGLCCFTLEHFLEKYPYKVGDKVTHNMGIPMNVVHMCWDAKCNVIRYDIQSPVDNSCKFKAMLAEHLQPYKEETMETITIDDFKANTKEWLIDKLHGMIISDAIKTIGNIHDELHKPKYPKTFIEVLNFWHPDRQNEDNYQRCYKKDLIEKFQDLLYARAAYWKIAGEEMGLGKPWKQDYDDRCFIIANNSGNIHTYEYHGSNNIILAFPTKEIRDAFYENFKDLINECKELL